VQKNAQDTIALEIKMKMEEKKDGIRKEELAEHAEH
jgi:hypothetical protein